MTITGASISTCEVAKINNNLTFCSLPCAILITMQDSIFTRIIRGEIPCYKIYEDDTTLAFLDIHPKQPGHVLVIPKKQVEFVWDLDDADYRALMATVLKVARRLRSVLGRPYVGELVIGVDVPHAHVHVYPFATVEESQRIPDPTTEPNHTALTEMAKKLAF